MQHRGKHKKETVTFTIFFQKETCKKVIKNYFRTNFFIVNFFPQTRYYEYSHTRTQHNMKKKERKGSHVQERNAHTQHTMQKKCSNVQAHTHTRSHNTKISVTRFQVHCTMFPNSQKKKNNDVSAFVFTLR